MGPYCPIYGVSMLFINSFVDCHFSYLVTVLFSSLFIAIMEYGTSYLLEKIFNRTWWDYSRKRYQVQGRVCLDNMIIFGFGSVFLAMYVTPYLKNVFGRESSLMMVVTFLLFIVFVIDFFVSSKRHYFKAKENFLTEKSKKCDDML